MTESKRPPSCLHTIRAERAESERNDTLLKLIAAQAEIASLRKALAAANEDALHMQEALKLAKNYQEAVA